MAEKSFLEIGSGCGIVSMFAAIGGASLTVAVDVSPEAARNTKFNFEAHRLKNAYVVQGNLFNCISHRFDFVFFNAPYHGNRPNDWLEWAVSDEDYRSLKAFILGVRQCLKNDGRVILGFSESGDEDFLRSEFKRAGLEVLRIQEDNRRGYSCKYFTMAIN